MFFCAISGEPPQDPVVSQKSGHVYERRLILKYITENGTDPITGDKLEESDLITVKANPKTAAPRPPAATSIPALLHTLQNEWDALMLETFTLKQQYNSLRQELSYALYAQDAATRVVARMIRERDAAREALASVSATMGVAPAGNGGDVEMAEAEGEAGGIPEEVAQKIEETHQTLSAQRKKRKPPTGYVHRPRSRPSPRNTPSLPASPSPAGITALAVSTANPSRFLTGGNDKIVQLYDRSTDKVLAALPGHQKKITHVAVTDLLLSGSTDKTARVWAHDTVSGEYKTRAVIRTHKGEVTGLAMHPTNTLVAMASTDRTYSLHDLTSGSLESFTSLGVHPDGTLLAVGTPASTIQVYDIRSGVVAASLSPPESTPFTVKTLSFSENGYHMLAPDSSPLSQSGTCLRGEGARIFAHKSWEELVRFEEGGEVADFVFGAEGKEVWGATGREVRVWGLPA
ncbi:WD40 repeat-like protein [Fomitopsis serialis]|uniref:WD40 repeat-like protein n=1 Tax=Fomitopsis serialis TaxID=139415 RepID=UPI002008D3D4|nr:WD40 repeat-like protein [Neoantrodia serialis]KAH9919113.1 WD40 repeat-like protein [Neoantrodia serialis]